MDINKSDRFIEITLDRQEEVIPYQWEMLMGNGIKGLLRVRKQVKNDLITLYYDAEGMISLKKYLNGGTLHPDEFLKLCSSTVDTFVNIQEFLLSSKGIVVDLEYLFFNPRDYQVGLIYLPIEDANTSVGEIQEALKKLLFSGAVDLSKGEIISQITGKFNEPIDTIEGLQENIKKLMTSKRKAVPVQEEMEKAIISTTSDNAPLSQQNKNMEPLRARPEKGHRRTDKIKEPKQDKKEKLVKEGGVGIKDRLILLVAGGVSLLLVSYLYTSGFFIEEGKTDYMTLGVAVLVFVGINFLIFKKRKEAAAKKKDTTEISNKKREKVRRIKNYTERKMPISKSDKLEKVYPSEEGHVIENHYNSENVLPDTAHFNMDKTEGMEPLANAIPYLEDKFGKRYFLIKTYNRIGRNKEDVAICVPNSKVGGKHADIIKQGDKMYILDLNSLNGTYVNESQKRIASGVEYELFNNDKIRFANEEYTIHF